MSLAEISARGKASIRIAPAPGVTVARIRDELLQIGLKPTIDWADKTLFLPSADLAAVQAILKEFSLAADSQTQDLVREIADSEESRVRSRRALKALTTDSAANAALSDFSSKAQLDPHQLQAVAVATSPDVTGLCLFDEQGLGKTVTALFSFHRLKEQGLISHALILCPKNMVMEWERDANRFFPTTYKCRTITGSLSEKRRLINEAADLYISNFETPVRLLLRMKELLNSNQKSFLLIIDESFYVKNPDALRSAAILSLRKHASRCLVLCGTPAPNRPHDLVGQFNIADQGSTFRGITLPDERDDAVPIVRKAIIEKGVFLRRLKVNALPNLPAKSFQRILLPMEGSQERMYADYSSKLTKQLEGLTDLEFNRSRTSILGRRMKLLQICSQPSAVDEQYSEVPAKLLALDSLLKELIEVRKEKVVLWCYFTSSLEAIIARYSRYNPARYDGHVTDPYIRREAVTRFQTDPTTWMFVGNLAAASAGLTLHAARYAIYESYSNQAAHYLQSLDRIHRRGQTRPVEYIFLLCDRTIEIVELDRLIEKESMAKDLLGDAPNKQITRNQMIKEVQYTSHSNDVLHPTN